MSVCVCGGCGCACVCVFMFMRAGCWVVGVWWVVCGVGVGVTRVPPLGQVPILTHTHIRSRVLASMSAVVPEIAMPGQPSLPLSQSFVPGRYRLTTWALPSKQNGPAHGLPGVYLSMSWNLPEPEYCTPVCRLRKKRASNRFTVAQG